MSIKQLLILSGKGGTGKTGIVAALAAVTHKKPLVLADCDVDAANLCFLAGGEIEKEEEFYAGFLASVDKALCTGCGLCDTVCKFSAIEAGDIDELECEGCGACMYICPQRAIALDERQSGKWLVSRGRFGKLVHAELGIAIENSGRLVSKVRSEAVAIAKDINAQRIIIDGPPGIGCPVIAAATGVDLVLAVVEPSVAAFHDLERLMLLMKKLKRKMLVCINKYTLNETQTTAISAWCSENDCEVIARIPYSRDFPKAIAAGKTVLDVTSNPEIISGIEQLCAELDRRLVCEKTGIFDKIKSAFRG